MKPVLIFLAVLAMVIGGGAVAWKLFQESVRPFDGETDYDFGVVLVPGDKVVVSHVFTLRNGSGQTLHIDHLHGSCGCINATADKEVIEPGETVNITATLEISGSKIKEEEVGIHTREKSVQTLTMTARGRRDPPLFTTRDQIRFKDDGTIRLVLSYWTYEDGRTPEPVQLELPDSVHATIDQWTAGKPGIPAKNWPTRWSARVDLTCSDTESVSGEVVAVAGVYRITIPIESAEQSTAEDAPESPPPPDADS